MAKVNARAEGVVHESVQFAGIVCATGITLTRCTCAHVRMHACTHARMHACMHARTHARMHTCVHACTHRSKPDDTADVHINVHKDELNKDGMKAFSLSAVLDERDLFEGGLFFMDTNGDRVRAGQGLIASHFDRFEHGVLPPRYNGKKQPLYTHTCTYIHIHTHTYTYIHIHTHTCMQTATAW